MVPQISLLVLLVDLIDGTASVADGQTSRATYYRRLRNLRLNLRALGITASA